MYIGNDLRSGRAEVFHYTSTSGGETAVTTASDGRSIRYDVGYCNVYLNGVRLHDSDYAATTGTSITNLAALSQNDVLIVEAPSTFSTTNTVPASGGSFTGPLTIDGGINQKAAAQDLSGTYANERMYINDAYTLKGDVSITGHLALGSISSGDIVITDDGNNREISGTGTLETGGILQERNTLLTGMTGTLGTGVFPAGMIINVTSGSVATETAVDAVATYQDVLTVTPTLKQAGNKYLLRAIIPVHHYTGGASMWFATRIYRTTSTASEITFAHIHRISETNTGETKTVMIEGFDTSPVASTEYKLQIKASSHDHYPIWCQNNAPASLIIMEIQV